MNIGDKARYIGTPEQDVFDLQLFYDQLVDGQIVKESDGEPWPLTKSEANQICNALSERLKVVWPLRLAQPATAKQEGYPGQAFFHEHNPNIAATERRADRGGEDVSNENTFESLEKRWRKNKDKLRELRDRCIEGAKLFANAEAASVSQAIGDKLTALLGDKP